MNNMDQPGVGTFPDRQPTRRTRRLSSPAVPLPNWTQNLLLGGEVGEGENWNHSRRFDSRFNTRLLKIVQRARQR